MNNQELLDLRKNLTTSVNKLKAILDLFGDRKFANVINSVYMYYTTCCLSCLLPAEMRSNDI